MKILLPKTLAEPGTIPWERITFNEVATVNRIWEALRKYLDDMGKSNGHSRPIKFIEMSLRILAIRAGGIEVDSNSGTLINNGKSAGHIFYIHYKTRRGGPRLTARLYERHSDLKARYAR